MVVAEVGGVKAAAHKGPRVHWVAPTRGLAIVTVIRSATQPSVRSTPAIAMSTMCLLKSLALN